MVDALHHVINHAASAHEMFRVLKPGLLIIEEPDIRTFGVKVHRAGRKNIVDAKSFPRAGCSDEIIFERSE